MSAAGTTVGYQRHFEVRLELQKFPTVPSPGQRKIAAVLSAYDDLIENNTRRIKILEGMAAAIYREWFVEFRFPGHDGCEDGGVGVGLDARRVGSKELR